MIFSGATADVGTGSSCDSTLVAPSRDVLLVFIRAFQHQDSVAGGSPSDSGSSISLVPTMITFSDPYSSIIILSIGILIVRLAIRRGAPVRVLRLHIQCRWRIAF